MNVLTLISLRTAISQLVEETFSTSGSHPTSMIDLWINESISQYENERYGENGGAIEKSETLTTNTSTAVDGVTSLPLNQYVAVNTAAKAVKSVWLVRGNQRIPMQQLAESDRGVPWVSWGNAPGMPTHYEVIQVQGSGGLAPMAIHFWPPAGAAYSLEVNYYPITAYLVADADFWNFYDGTLDCVICDVAMRILERNDEADGAQYAAYRERRERAYRALRLAIAQRSRGTLAVRDTRGAMYAVRQRWIV